MKKLLFLLVCALLLLLASASPALADFWYQVSPYDGSVTWANDDTLEWDFDSDGVVPAGVDTRVGFTLITLNRGGSMPQAKNLLLRLVVIKAGSPPSTPPVVLVDEFTCQRYWGAPYDYNAWMTGHPDFVIPHFNPKIGAVVTGRDWLVPLPALTPGDYEIFISDKLTKKWVDPLYMPPGETPLKTAPWDWMDFSSTFRVSSAP
jgi:hypothetical protein